MFARDFQVLLSLGKLLASLRQFGLQLLSAGLDLLFHAAQVMRSADQLALQMESERVNLSFGPDACFGWNASVGIEDESPFQVAPPFEQHLRARTSDGWDLRHIFYHVGGGLDAV